MDNVLLALPIPANVIIPLAFPQFSFMLFAIVPVILIEGCILGKIAKIPLKKALWVMAVANVITTFVGVFYGSLVGETVLHGVSNRNADACYVVLSVIAFFLTVAFESWWGIEKLGDFSRTKVCVSIIIANVVTYSAVMAFTVPRLEYQKSYRFVKARRIEDAMHLKKIYLSLQAYAQDNGGWFPDKDNTAGLEQLRKTGYLEDGRLLVSPFTGRTPPDMSVPLQPGSIDYIYEAGHRPTDHGAVPIMWTMNYASEFSTRALFAQGRVRILYGKKDWIKELKEESRRSKQ